MAIPNWSDAGTAQQLGLDRSRLMSIINASTEASTKMRSLNGQVEGAAGMIIQAMQSDAGSILSRRLFTWREDFHAIVNSFDQLTDRTQHMLLALQQADSDATQNAQR